MTTSSAAEILSRLQEVADARMRAMMGGWLVSVDGVLVGQVNEGDLFVTSTAFAASFAPALERRPPYDGAEPALVVPIALLDDQAWLPELLAGSVAALRKRREAAPLVWLDRTDVARRRASSVRLSHRP